MNEQLAANVVAAHAREANFAYVAWREAEAEAQRLHLAYFDAVAALKQAEKDNS